MRIKKFLFAGLLGLLASPATADLTSMPAHGDGPLQIQAEVYVVDLQAINNAKQSYTGNVFYHLKWLDTRLVHAGRGNKTLKLEDVWHPNIQVLNRQRVFLTFPDEVKVSPAGEVSLQQRMWGDFTQPTDLRNFPFDAHQFNFDLIAVGLSPEQVILIQDESAESAVARDYTLPDWTITGWKAGTWEFKPLPNGAVVVSGFRFSFEAQRNTTFYILKVILPLLLLASLSWLVFWIDIKESSIQVSVSITTILTLIAYRFAIGSSLPAVSYLTRMDSMILGATILTFAALGMVVLIQSILRSDRPVLAAKVQLACRIIFPTALLTGVFQWLVF